MNKCKTNILGFCELLGWMEDSAQGQAHSPAINFHCLENQSRKSSFNQTSFHVPPLKLHADIHLLRVSFQLYTSTDFYKKIIH